MTHAAETPRMIAVDMDGTLVHPGGFVSPGNKAALDRARAAGVRIVIATGRRHSYAMKILREVPLHADDIVLSSNGTVARTVGGRLIFRNTMPLPTAQWLCEALGEFRNSFVLTFDLLGEDGRDMPGALVLEELDELHGSIRSWMEANGQYIRRVQPIHLALPSAQSETLEAELPIQAMLCGSMERMSAAEALLAGTHDDRLTLHRTEYPARDLCILDILPKGCSKGSGLRRLLALEGLSAADLMSIGDNWNDLPMFDVARWVVLMGNAPAALQDLARRRGWQVGEEHTRDAVAQAIDSYFGNSSGTAPDRVLP